MRRRALLAASIPSGEGTCDEVTFYIEDGGV